MEEYKGEIRKTCPYHQVDTVKAAASAFISYNVVDAKQASRKMLDIVEKLRDKVLSVNPGSVSYDVEDFSIIGKRSKEHTSRYPESIDQIIPLDKDKNAQSLYERVAANKHPFVQNILEMHNSELDECKSHIAAARRVMRIITRLTKSSSIKNLNYEDVQTLLDYQSIQERPENATPIIRFNSIIEKRPDIVHEILKVQSQVCTVLQELIDENPQYGHEEIAYSEFGFLHEGKVVPNSRLLKVITNNYGPYFYKYEDESAAEILSKSSKDAEADRMFSQSIFLFQDNKSSFDLVGVDNRACPAINSIGPIIRHLSQ